MGNDGSMETKDYLALADTTTVRDNSNYDLAMEYVGILNKEIKKTEDYFGPKKKKAEEAHQLWVDAEKESLTPFIKAKRIIQGKCDAYLIRKQEEAEKLHETAKIKAFEKGFDQTLVRTPEVMPTDHKRVVYKYRIDDFSKLSDEYKLPDTSGLTKLAVKTKGEAKLDGVTFFKTYIAV